ncbi:olfactory receptor 2H2-like [Notamacropus eugenii]|uniref:olfactory receptor 2H2-like n=1 Tax=Notamacropus eugenii TaxID=9315 RepID=UPI003B679196
MSRIYNVSSRRYFILVGFSDQPQLEIVLFWVILIFYCLTIVGNRTIILISYLEPRLHTPMYFFLSNLSLLKLCFTTSCVPQMLVNLFGPEKTISYIGCAIQLYVFLWLGATECILLVIMAVDRSVAICRPLHYVSIMHPRFCLQLVILTWGSGLIQSMIQIPSTLHLPFCLHHRVDDFVCEVPAMIRLSCGDTTYNEIQLSVSSIILLVVPLIVILISYGAIAKTILKMKSTAGQRKAIGICGSHLVVVSLFYCAVTAVYLQPKSQYSQKQGKLFTLFYTVVTPILNPIIYTLRKKEVKIALRQLGKRNCISWEIYRR